MSDADIFPRPLHFELVTDLDNVGQFVGQRVNVEDAKYVSIEKAAWHKLQRLAVEGRLAKLAHKEVRMVLDLMFKKDPDLTPRYYAASLEVAEEEKRNAVV